MATLKIHEPDVESADQRQDADSHLLTDREFRQLEEDVKNPPQPNQKLVSAMRKLAQTAPD